MFERFTDRARRVIVLAQEEARLLNHNYIGTEHLLLGMVHEGDSVAGQAVASFDVDLGTLRTSVESIVGRGAQMPSGHIPFTPRSKKVLEFSLREAMQLGHNYIGSEHILLGLLREGEGAGARALVNAGIDPMALRGRVLAGIEAGIYDEPVEQREEEPQFLTVTEATRDVGCAFCGRDLYAVERAVTNHAGVIICLDCARSAVETMEQSTEPGAPVKPLALPPHVYGDVPDEQAVREIVALFSAWSTKAFDLSFLAHVEDGPRLEGVQAALRAGHGPQLPHNLFDVDRVRFVSPDEAAVRFRMTVLPHQTFDGRAVRAGGGWKVSRDTYCAIARLGGVACPDDEWDDDAS